MCFNTLLYCQESNDNKFIIMSYPIMQPVIMNPSLAFVALSLRADDEISSKTVIAIMTNSLTHIGIWLILLFNNIT